MTTTVKAADPAQFLSLVPRLLGYVPTASIVLVPFTRGRSLGALRIDLPPEHDPGACERVASSALGMVCRVPDAEAVIAVLYTDAVPFGDAFPSPHFASALGRSADACGLGLIDVLAVTADGWSSFCDPRRRGERTAIEDATPPAAAAGPVHTGDQSTGAGLPLVDLAEQERVAAALCSLRTALEVICGIPAGAERASRIDPAALEAACALDDLPQLFEEALEWDAGSLTAMQAASLSWCLARPSLRDVALVQWSSDLDGGDAALEAQRRWEDGEEYPADLAAVMWGEDADPDPARLAAALGVARHVAALTPEPDRAGPLAACAWLSWALGRSTHADRLAEQAQSSDPDHGLADIVRSFVAAGHLPDWAFRRR